MPMIRYDTGDLAAIETIEINGRRKKCLTQFSGRKVDVIFDTSGNSISPHLITNEMWSFTDIKQFQLIQKSEKDYLLKLNADKDFSRDFEIDRALTQHLGEDAVITIEKVDEIPVLSSGKRRYIVNEYKR